jgi:subtilisin family serine protease
MAFANAQTPPGQFVARPGVKEFTGEMIVRPLQPDALARQGKNELQRLYIRQRAGQRISRLARKFVRETDEYVIRVPAGKTENQFSVELMRTGDYQYAEPNWMCYPVAVPNDPQYPSQWHHPRVKSPEAWNLVTGSNSVIVAVVDTGIDLSHPDLAPNRVPGYNSVDEQAEVDGGQVNDLNGHGTHVAGCAAAIGNNGVGVSGMGWNFKIMMVRTSNSPGGGSTIDQITGGSRWAADNGARVVSASYSGVDASPVGTTGTYIKTKNAVYLYAAGNDNRNLNTFYWQDTIVVGASTATDAKAGFSAYGPAIHVFAPGVNILSTTNGGGYGPSSGTSMAAPVANGACALIIAANPTLTAQQVQDCLESQCDNIGPSNIFGFGRINQFKAVTFAQSFTPVIEEPIDIQTVLGTHLSGTLADILVPNTGGPSYDIASTSLTRPGAMAAFELKYNIGSVPNLLSLEFIYETKLAPSLLVTGHIYGWNVNTSSWELIGQHAISSTSWSRKAIKLTVNPGRFVSGTGEIRLLYRALGNAVGGRHPIVPFTLKVGHAQCRLIALP